MFLADQIKSIPSKPGVYFFKSKGSKILYIGKAKNLKNRIRSYINKKNLDNKSKIMVSKSHSLDYFTVSDEVEAIIAEANMIKEYKPRYNVVLKDDKTFPYILIRNEIYPRLEIIRKKNLKKDNNTYFGPYTDVRYLKEVFKILCQTLPIKTCSSPIYKNIAENNMRFNRKTCFCSFCVSRKPIGEKEYDKIIATVKDFLKGKSSTIKKQVEELMNKASKDLRFEDAAKHRNSLMSINSFIKKQKKVCRSFSDYDIVHTSLDKRFGIGVVMRVRNGLLIGRERFEFSVYHDSFENILKNFLIQYYNNTQDIPNELVLNTLLDGGESIKEWLISKKGKKISFTYPKVGEKRKLLNLCIKNADMILKQTVIKKIKRKEFIPKTLKELKRILSMKKIPKRIEAFDNSNFQGASPVAGMVCFINGKPIRTEFRRFNIKTVSGIDDYKSMEEVITRRYLRQKQRGGELPDLILIDGGKGQLSVAKKALEKISLSHIDIAGIAKKLEEVFIPESKHPQNINKDSPALFLLRSIRDEVHRYSVEFHRLKRSQKTFSSNLSKISGLGKKRYQLLLSRYKTLKNIAIQDPEKINSETKIPINICNKITEALNSK